MVNAYIEDSETDQLSVDEFAGTEIRWSRKGTFHYTDLCHFFEYNYHFYGSIGTYGLWSVLTNYNSNF